SSCCATFSAACRPKTRSRSCSRGWDAHTTTASSSRRWRRGERGVPRFPKGRLLAMYHGERRIGLAVSDPLGMIASPAGFIVRRAGKRIPIAELVRRAEALEARGFVVGLPLDGDGNETPRAAEARHIAA